MVGDETIIFAYDKGKTMGITDIQMKGKPLLDATSAAKSISYNIENAALNLNILRKQALQSLQLM